MSRSDDKKTYRWLRVLEYVGTLGFINDAVAKRNIKGSKTLTKGVIRESFIGDTPIALEPLRGLTHDETIVACRNIGINLSCGGCAAAFYTGHAEAHDENCTVVGTYSSLVAPENLTNLDTVMNIPRYREFVVVYQHQNSNVVGIATAKRNAVGWQECSEPGQPNIIQWWNPGTGRFEDWS